MPMFFQLIFGSKVAYRSMVKKFWKISLISIIGQILMIFLGSYIMISIIKSKGINDGLPIFGTILIGVFLGLITLIIIGFQLYSIYQDKK
jgi:hypothetical protein